MSSEPWKQRCCGAAQRGGLFVGCQLSASFDVSVGADGDVSSKIWVIGAEQDMVHADHGPQHRQHRVAPR